MTAHTLSDAQLESLIAHAVAGKDRSYSPYSKFRVGAALLTRDGVIFSGCNVENASYGGCICAERTAVVKAVSEGHRKILAIAVATDLDSFATPCGICRQYLSEFNKDMIVVLTKVSGAHRITSMRELLPESFGPEDLGIEAP
ncbi:cytidine deaminase-like protein [Blastocladiella britannica]|nr:cytidine deaminase-like protein [Blastocladiella britannica]